jgi:hypothetical protein
MKKIWISTIFLLGAALFGCGALIDLRIKNMSDTTTVFREIGAEEAPVRSYADLLVKAQLKTHAKGYYLLEGEDSLEGKPKIPLIFNIDGQVVTWEADGRKEDTPKYTSDGMHISDGGPGVRYLLEKKIRLSPGLHKISIAITHHGYLNKFEITLIENSVNILECRPIYNRDRWIDQSYVKGIRNFEILLNGKPVP